MMIKKKIVHHNINTLIAPSEITEILQRNNEDCTNWCLLNIINNHYCVIFSFFHITIIIIAAICPGILPSADEPQKVKGIFVAVCAEMIKPQVKKQ